MTSIELIDWLKRNLHSSLRFELVRFEVRRFEFIILWHKDYRDVKVAKRLEAMQGHVIRPFVQECHHDLVMSISSGAIDCYGSPFR